MKNALEVNIAGQRYVLKSDSDGDRLRAIADIVTAKVDEVRKAGKHLPTDKVAILAAVNIAEELLRERESTHQLKDAVRQRTERLIACLKSLAPLAAADDAQRQATIYEKPGDDAPSDGDDRGAELAVDPAEAPPVHAAPREPLAPLAPAPESPL